MSITGFSPSNNILSVQHVTASSLPDGGRQKSMAISGVSLQEEAKMSIQNNIHIYPP